MEERPHQLQEVYVTLSHHLHKAKVAHKKAANCHHLESLLNELKFRVGDILNEKHKSEVPMHFQRFKGRVEKETNSKR